jgi:hypothetical protein
MIATVAFLFVILILFVLYMFGVGISNSTGMLINFI